MATGGYVIIDLSFLTAVEMIQLLSGTSVTITKDKYDKLSRGIISDKPLLLYVRNIDGDATYIWGYSGQYTATESEEYSSFTSVFDAEGLHSMTVFVSHYFNDDTYTISITVNS